MEVGKGALAASFLLFANNACIVFVSYDTIINVSYAWNYKTA